MTQNVELTAFQSYALLFVIGALLVWGIWNHLRLAEAQFDLLEARDVATRMIESANTRERIFKTAFIQGTRPTDDYTESYGTEAAHFEAAHRELATCNATLVQRERTRWERTLAVKGKKETAKKVVAAGKLPYGLRASRALVKSHQAAAPWN